MQAPEVTTTQELNALREQAERDGVASLSEKGREDLNTDVQKSTFMDSMKSVGKTAWNIVTAPVELPAKGVEWATMKATGSETAATTAKWLTRAGMVALYGYLAWPYISGYLGEGFANIGGQAGNAVGDGIATEVGGAGATSPVNPLGPYSNLPVEAPVTPIGGGGALESIPPAISPGGGGGMPLPDPLIEG